MAIYHFDCHKCTNKYIGVDETYNGVYCKPAVDAFIAGREHEYTWDWHDGGGKNAEAWCKDYKTEPRQAEIHPLAVGAKLIQEGERGAERMNRRIQR